jgi:osmotically-inducible protein OsmY
MARIDEEIKKDIVDTLYWDGRVDASDVTVEVNEGKVVLKGHIPSLLARTAAEEDAISIPGVIEINNQISVRYPKTIPLPSDEEIAVRVRDSLRLNPIIQGTDIEVEVRGGIATLRGTVDAFWKKGYANDVAANERGVLFIQNHLAVVPTQKLSDQAIARDIESALERNTLVDADAVNIQVENGNVFLGGSLPNWTARRAAENAALYTPGVINVDNRIEIMPGL